MVTKIANTLSRRNNATQRHVSKNGCALCIIWS